MHGFVTGGDCRSLGSVVGNQTMCGSGLKAVVVDCDARRIRGFSSRRFPLGVSKASNSLSLEEASWWLIVAHSGCGGVLWLRLPPPSASG